jgi:hypothetical protein
MAAPQLETTCACLPSTERGRGILVAGDQKSERIAYTNGRTVILRSLDNPLDCNIYSEHSYATTVARFSPNGEWVASGDVSGQVQSDHPSLLCVSLDWRWVAHFIAFTSAHKNVLRFTRLRASSHVLGASDCQ